MIWKTNVDIKYMKRQKRSNSNNSKNEKRIINLTMPLSETYIPWPDEPLHMTLCAGDGVQMYNNTRTTDIEYFTRKYEGWNRENKDTNIFCCSPDTWCCCCYYSYNSFSTVCRTKNKKEKK